ncbi:MAG: patatin-like phospholipase family protein [Acidobacteriota bacterium]|nr:patatin-like phospholipase family protein [Acidobacteriota bacterium]
MPEPVVNVSQFERILQHAWKALAETLGVAPPPVSITREDWEGFSRGIAVYQSLDSETRAQIAHEILTRYGAFESSATAPALQNLLRQSTWMDAPAGAFLIRGGSPPDFVYKLITGMAAVFLVQPDALRRPAGTIGPGGIIGEIEFVTNTPFQAEIQAVRDVELVRIPRAAFLDASRAEPGLWETVARAAAGHVGRLIGRDFPTAVSHVLAVAPAGCGSEASSLPAFCHALTGAFDGETAQWLGSRQVDAELGEGAAQALPDSAGAGRLREFMSLREAAGHRLILQCDAALTPWTKRCLAQADRVLFVAAGSSAQDDSPNEIEGVRLPVRGRKDLVFLTGAGSPPANTAEWLAKRRIETVLHIRDGSAETARLGRFLSGQARGLVLSGGGARGFAHIGVVRAMQELGMPIDIAGGASMGACIAALCALGLSWQEILERTREVWVRRRPLRDYTVPLVSLLSGRRIDRALEWMFGDTQIESLRIPYYAVSSNLVDGRVVTHRQGLLRRAIRVSISVPGILPPVASPGSLLVDGGVLNNLPVDVMRDLSGTRHIVAVDVNPYGCALLAGCPEYGDSLTGWKAIRQRFGRARKNRIPDIHAILERATMLGSIGSMAETLKLVEYYLHPATDSFGFLEMNKIDEIVELGYRFARMEFESRLG